MRFTPTNLCDLAWNFKRWATEDFMTSKRKMCALN